MVKLWSGRLTGLVVTIWLMMHCLQSAASTPFTLLDTSFDQSISRYVSLLEDPDRDLTAEQVSNRDYQLRFTPSHAESIRLEVTSSVYWFRISISNPLPETRRAILSLSNGHMESPQLYDITDPAHPVLNNFPGSRSSGSYLQAHTWPLDINGHDTRTYLLRVQGNGLLNADIRLMTADQFLMREQYQSILVGLVCGWLLATAAWFIHLALVRNSRLAIWAALYCISSVIFVVAWIGNLGLLLGLGNQSSEIIFELAAAVAIAAHIMACHGLGWRGGSASLIRNILAWLAAAEMLAGIFLALLPGGFSELLSLLVIVMAELGLSLILIRYDSDNNSNAQRWILTGSLLAIVTVLLVMLTSFNLISMDLVSVWAVLMLPSWLALSLVLATFNLSRNSDQHLEPGSRGISITPELLSQVSHELRSPINGVSGMSELLGDTPLSDNQREFTEIIAQAGREMLHIADEISDLARIRNDHLELDNRAFDIMNLVNRTLAHFQMEANRKQIELVVDHDEQLPARLLGDSTRLQTLLHNMFSLLLAYTEQGELSVHISRHHNTLDKSGGNINLQIQLQGNIANRHELRAQLIQLTNKESSDQKTPPKSWNLLVMYQLMRFMGVSLDIESLTAQGGSLTLYLQQLQEADDLAVSPLFDDSLIGMHILVVDDNASLRKVIEKQVKRWGVRVDSTHSGKEALAMLRNQCALGQPYEGAIIDLDMPVMDGLELARRLHDDDKIPSKPNVLMLTGLSISSVRENAQQVGITHFLGKPASGERLKRALLQLRYRPGQSSL
jgi:two-component system, sensor histidine kinase RetS